MTKEYDEVHKVSKIVMGLAVKWWLFFLVLSIIASVAALALKPAFLGFERKIFVASHQYQESHETGPLNPSARGRLPLCFTVLLSLRASLRSFTSDGTLEGLLHSRP